MDTDQPIASGSSSPKRSNVVYIPDGNSFSAVAQTPQVPLSTRPSAGGEAVVCIDNGELLTSPMAPRERVAELLGSHSWRAGFAGSADPYIDKANMVARYKERKVGKNIMLFGRDVEADSNSRSSIRSMFDGDMLIHGEILVCHLPRLLQSNLPRLEREIEPADE
jgi:actin-related protein 5